MQVAVYARPLSSNTSAEALHILFQKLKACGIEAFVYEPLLKQNRSKWRINATKFFSKYEDIKGKVKFLFSIGGDGTLLEAVALVRDSGIAIMGINTGRLGFLSSISKDEIEMAVDALLKKKYSIDKRTLLELVVKGNYFSGCRFALNEVVAQKMDSSSMITVHASVNGNFLNTYWADGLIVSTPTGSTAYSLSCGGPIVMPDLDNFIIAPIAPHNLNVRPVIISSNDVVKLEVECRHPNFLVSLDAHSEPISSSLELTIKKAKFSISLVKLRNYDFLSTLRNKLMWGMDKRN